MRQLLLLFRLRYRLLWAQVRLRNGKVALFFLGYLVVCLVAALLAVGGVGAALVSIRAGRAELVARVALAASYVLALAASAVLGFGTDGVFADAVMRRYPLSDSVSLAGRHFLAVMEPLWIVVAALNLGLAAGFHILGVAPFWLGGPAALLLTATDYVLARVISSLIRHIMATRSGPIVLLLALMPLFVAPATLGPLLVHKRAFAAAALAVLRFTPPFAAASIMAGAPALHAAAWLLYLLVCSIALTVALVWIDRWPLPKSAIAAARASWGSPLDRVASYFGPTLEPLVGKVLRYYARSPQLRFNFPGAALAPALFAWRHRGHPGDSFLSTLGIVSIVGAICMGSLPINIFGFDGNGLRRYFLMPVSTMTVLAATALVPLALGSALIPISLVLWLVTTPVHLDFQMIVMLLSSGFGGMLLLQALDLWIALYSPRQIDFYATMGNKLSFAANAAMLIPMFGMIGLAGGLPQLGMRAVMAYWWIWPLILLVAAVVYLVTLRACASLLDARREGLISVVERGY